MQRHLDLFMKYIFGQNLPKIANYIEYLTKASHHTGIPRFMLLMWGHTKSKNRVNPGYLVVLNGRKIG